MEKKLKNVSRSKKIEIIERGNPDWRDLYPETAEYDPAQLLRNSQDLAI